MKDYAKAMARFKNDLQKNRRRVAAQPRAGNSRGHKTPSVALPTGAPRPMTLESV